ncbi:hypothetical protein COCNU_scaffold039360G000010 [Cocos nucifera]|nr:hypothetical protein [Cocos nucifera]
MEEREGFESGKTEEGEGGLRLWQDGGEEGLWRCQDGGKEGKEGSSSGRMEEGRRGRTLAVAGRRKGGEEELDCGMSEEWDEEGEKEGWEVREVWTSMREG